MKKMKKLNPLKLKNYSGEDIDVYLTVEEYANSGQLAILLYEKETGEYYTDLSIFVKEFEDKGYVVLDINNFPGAEEFVQRHNLGQLFDYIQSGFVSYPIYQMDLNELRKYDPEGVDKFIEDNGIKEVTLWDRLRN